MISQESLDSRMAVMTLESETAPMELSCQENPGPSGMSTLMPDLRSSNARKNKKRDRVRTSPLVKSDTELNKANYLFQWLDKVVQWSQIKIPNESKMIIQESLESKMEALTLESVTAAMEISCQENPGPSGMHTLMPDLCSSNARENKKKDRVLRFKESLAKREDKIRKIFLAKKELRKMALSKKKIRNPSYASSDS